MQALKFTAVAQNAAKNKPNQIDVVTFSFIAKVVHAFSVKQKRFASVYDVYVNDL